ncbi:ABC transporter substrate-binding protein [Candidatus Poriferisodalis sp.]|uniref:ABC transporter substrate-binding protein n=1 Tax=Candidatus Poriferisodalis sp. TaxID=3101277 RepID=UPI003B023490
MAALVVGVAILLAAACTGMAPDDAPTAEAPAPTTAPMADAPVNPGVFDDRVLFGQSAAFSGPAQALGQAMRLGIEAAFAEQNQAGGVHGRMLELVTLDDRYEPGFAFANTRDLIAKERVFALIGEVGTPTSRSAVPLAESRAVPFVAPFTGAGFLRDPDLNSVVNLRASYAQETEHMVERLTSDLGVTKVAVMYQNDSYGQSGLNGVTEALDKRGLAPAATWYYERNSSAVKSAVFHIAAAQPEAVIFIGAYQPVAKAIQLLRTDVDPVFMAVSFVGSNALAQELGDDAPGVYVTQVVPIPDDADTPVVADYRSALSEIDPDAAPGFVSLEGYLAGRLAIVALEACDEELTRACFLGAFTELQSIDLAGVSLNYGPGDNQGSDEVLLTVINDEGKFVQVADLGDTQ